MRLQVDGPGPVRSFQLLVYRTCTYVRTHSLTILKKIHVFAMFLSLLYEPKKSLWCFRSSSHLIDRGPIGPSEREGGFAHGK